MFDCPNFVQFLTDGLHEENEKTSGSPCYSLASCHGGAGVELADEVNKALWDTITGRGLEEELLLH